MRKILCALFLILIAGAPAYSSVIDFIERADGYFDVVIDGQQNGRIPKAGAEKVAQMYQNGGNNIKWTWRNSTTTGGTSGGGGAGVPPINTTPQKQLPAGNQPKQLTSGNQPKESAAPAKKASTASKVGATIGLISGMGLIIDSGSDKDEKVSWAEVGQGAAGGALASSSLVALNVIPVGGQIAYGVTVGVGALVGAAKAGSRKFSETDCDMDPVMGVYVCCNVSKLTKLKKAIFANIGDEMFGQFPNIRTCLQGKDPYEHNWFVARFLDDHWDDAGKPKLCPGYVMPTVETEMIQLYGYRMAENKYCWMWECADESLVRENGECVPISDPEYEMGPAPAPHRAGEKCDAADLPQYATAGIYIKTGGELKCAATACRDNTYLVVNASGLSMGWCTGRIQCADGTEMNIIDGTKTDRTCIKTGPDDAVADNAEQSEQRPPQQSQQPAPDTRNECERGVSGYVVFEGDCITEYEQTRIITQRREQAMAASRAKIDDAYAKIQNITANLPTTVWRDKDGNFNKARLASDSIAGVVLGVTGGLVTNKIIKKSQLSNGFEALQCTVGGQTVATYGDEFRIDVSVASDQ